MKLTVDDREAAPGEVTYNDGQGFGRFDGDHLTVHPFRLNIERQELLDALSDRFDEVRAEMKWDDESFPDGGQGPSDFHALDYRPLAECFDNPAALAEVLGTYFRDELFEAFVGWRESGFTYVINSIDAFEVESDGMTVEGRCFQLKR
jgi:hypothetical protein